MGLDINTLLYIVIGIFIVNLLITRYYVNSSIELSTDKNNKKMIKKISGQIMSTFDRYIVGDNSISMSQSNMNTNHKNHKNHKNHNQHHYDQPNKKYDIDSVNDPADDPVDDNDDNDDNYNDNANHYDNNIDDRDDRYDNDNDDDDEE